MSKKSRTEQVQNQRKIRRFRQRNPCKTECEQHDFQFQGKGKKINMNFCMRKEFENNRIPIIPRKAYLKQFNESLFKSERPKKDTRKELDDSIKRETKFKRIQSSFPVPQKSVSCSFCGSIICKSSYSDHIKSLAHIKQRRKSQSLQKINEMVELFKNDEPQTFRQSGQMTLRRKIKKSRGKGKARKQI